MEFPKPPTSSYFEAATVGPTPQSTATPNLGSIEHFEAATVGGGVNATVSEAEMSFLIRKYLRPEQADDPLLIKFIYCYLECRNANQAARECGIPTSRGNYLRQRPEIHALIQAVTEKAVMKYGYDASEIIERVKEIGTFDPIVLQNPDGSFVTSLSQIPAEARRAIKSFKCKNMMGKDPNGMPVVIGQMIDVVMHDKLKSLELLGREKNIMKETRKVEHDVTSNMAALLLESKSRAEERVIDVTPEIKRIGDGG